MSTAIRSHPSEIVITLPSCTVFWCADLGMSPSMLNELRRDQRRATQVADEIKEWLVNNIATTDWDLWAEGVWFLDQKDAALFKMFWAGRFDQYAI